MKDLLQKMLLSSLCYWSVNTLKKIKAKLLHISSFQEASRCGHLGLVPSLQQHPLDSRCKRVTPLLSTLEIREERNNLGDSIGETLAVVWEDLVRLPNFKTEWKTPTFEIHVFGCVWRWWETRGENVRIYSSVLKNIYM